MLYGYEFILHLFSYDIRFIQRLPRCLGKHDIPTGYLWKPFQFLIQYLVQHLCVDIELFKQKRHYILIHLFDGFE